MPDVRPWQYTNFGTMRYWRQFGGTNVNMIIKYIRDKRLTIFFEILPRISNFLGPLFSAPESITDDLTTLMDRLKPYWSHSSLCWQITVHLAYWQPVSWTTKPLYPFKNRLSKFNVICAIVFVIVHIVLVVNWYFSVSLKLSDIWGRGIGRQKFTHGAMGLSMLGAWHC